MPRPKCPIPTYRRFARNNSARCWVGGRWVYLGPYDSPESRAEFARICAELAAGAAVAPRTGATVNELVAAFRRHAEEYYRRPDGTTTQEVTEFQAALRVVRRLYGDTPAREFGPVALQTVRAEMARPKADGGLGWCRTRVNAQVRRIRRAWKWAASQELVPGSVVHDLAAVAGLRRGRSPARETEPVGPVPDAHVTATLPFLVPTVRAMVEFQRASGLRPMEVRLLVPADLDTGGEVWVYRPAYHKMSHLGRDKAVPLSPAAVAVLRPWLEGKAADQPVFSPRQARAEMYARRRKERKSKVQPSQLDRSKPEAEKVRKTGERFTITGYCGYVTRAAKKAGVPSWSPLNLRHSFATEVRERFGLEACQVLLGHAKADVTQLYAERNMKLATEAAKQLGTPAA